MSELKPCKVCNFTRQQSYGLVVPSLDQLKIKVDGGTAWMTRESVNFESDVVDSSISGIEPWFYLAQQLKNDLASIILMSEADLQTLVDVPCLELASALGFLESKVLNLQDTLQRVLDRREEERQSKELLQLFLTAVERADSQEAEPRNDGSGDVDVTDGLEVDSASGFMSRTLMVLKGKTSPETRLSNEELQMVVNKGARAMEQVLGWDSERTLALLQACKEQLSKRLQQVQAMQSLSSHTQQQASTQPSDKSQATQAKRSK
ncbi:DNA fragmentation factor subunit alpha isoform X2 [Coregonus clupeaformis]|uniref:DNA fragmentation factor subunit alpha isoform X2 n=1 Tax=Coregonus clupeaformis TaxID=59861 RepID=UPI001BE0E766|nr:DNA fragmentation factor subunit alpha isoform X2 [Coregonus clupeaformis]